MGSYCPDCDHTYVPATVFCERCLGELTDWRDIGEDVYVGEGAKLFAVGGGDHKTIFDLQTIEFIKE